MSFRDAIWEEAQKGRESYKSHIDEALTACIKFIQKVEPEAEIVFEGYDLGGPRWKIVTPHGTEICNVAEHLLD